MDQTGASTALFGGIAFTVIVIWLFVVTLAIAATVFWIVEIVDVARREFPDPNSKIVWLLVIIFLHLIGAILYYVIGKPQGRLPGEIR